MLGSHRRSPVSTSVRSMLKPRHPALLAPVKSIARSTLLVPAIAVSVRPSFEAFARMLASLQYSGNRPDNLPPFGQGPADGRLSGGSQSGDMVRGHGPLTQCSARKNAKANVTFHPCE